MQAARLEALALDAIDRVLKGTGTEDSRIEFKSEWPTDHVKAARQLAGQCNASSGDDVIWIVGVDGTGGIVGCKPEDFAEWWSRVQARFSEKAPTLACHVTVAGQAAPVVVMAFHSDDAPFVVANPAFNAERGGPVELEVPWREGTRTRSARRQDLLRLLGRKNNKPLARLVHCNVCAVPESYLQEGLPQNLKAWEFTADIMVFPQLGTGLWYLEHKSRVELWSQDPRCDFQDLAVRISAPIDLMGRQSSGARFDGPIIEIQRACTLSLSAQAWSSADVEILEISRGIITLATATDEPELRIPIPPTRSQPGPASPT